MAFRGGRIPDDELLDALRRANAAHGDYVDADIVRRCLPMERQLMISTQGLGQRLSWLAKRELCSKRFVEIGNVYQSRAV